MASFFGFETTLPGRGAPRPNAGSGTHNSRRGGGGGGDAFGEELGGQLEVDSDEAFSGSRLDEQMERRFAYGQHVDEDEGTNDMNALEDDNEDLNDETFGGVASDRDKLGNDFDFSAGNARIAGAPLPREPPKQYRPAAVRAAPTDDRAFNLQSVDAAGEAERYRDQWEPNAREPIPWRPSELNRDNLAEIWTKPASPGMQDMHMNGALQFQQQQYNPHQGYSPPPPSQQQRPMSVSDIEAMMLRMQRAKVDPRHVTGPDNARTPREPTRPNQGYPPPPGMYNRLVDMNAPINAAELEAEYRARQAPRGHPQQHFMNQHAAMAMAMRQGSPPLQHLQQQQQQQQPPRPQGAVQNEQMGTPPRIESPIGYPDADRGYDDYHIQRGPRPPMQLGNFLPQPHPQHQPHQHQRGNQTRPLQGYARMDQRYVHRAYPDNRPDIRTREEKYKGTMTQYEKELIAKIQISQLVTDNPYRDDFYYIVYTSLIAANEQAADEPGKAPKGLNWQQSLLMDQTRGNGPNVTNRMQQQMQRLIEGRKAKPKGNSLSLEGALGKISLSSVRNPRQLLQVKGPTSPKDGKAPSAHDSPLLTTKQLFRRIENVYSKVLELEIMKRAGPPATRAENNDDDAADADNLEDRDEAKDSEQEWNARFEEHRANMWKELGVSEQVPLNYPHPFTALLAFGKGKKVIPRVFRFLTRDQSLALISMLLSRLETLDVCQPPAPNAGAPTPAQVADVELFMANVVPTVVSVVMECPLFVVNACMRILLERHNMVWLAKSKPGLAFLTMFLSRAEMIKQGAGTGVGADFSVPEQELHMWTEIYNFLFASLHNHFSSLFPSSLSPTSTLMSSTEAASAGATPANVAGDVYVWQFLAALAVGATTVEHQRVLLTEVRDKVLETARRSDDAKSLANVDLFLNALGLGIDARQLVNMSGF
ncbi:hypothetical protein HDU88_006206 [Geranomyces variabilis]|nr:hypothetical protein HDU88_006206 [Geranomyces variabilis]